MKLWFQKISVILITFMTLGMFIPPTYLEANANSNEIETNKELDGTIEDQNPSIFEEDTESSIEDSEHYTNSDYIVSMITEQAKDRTLNKLGPKILKQVETDITTTILPNMEEVLKMILQDAGEEEFTYYEITEQVTNGYGERIFNLYDHKAKKDVAMFHVRRDNKPKDGYWFNFHYHLEKDGFEEHYQLGDVYWDKNTPPKWMS
ncbi:MULTISPECIES: YpjP family protein [Bacillaceae]|uniref:YpjP family protein n=1 Tax=Evansella alkalicola TaxID=745819 RepID=A0ABS6JYX0_9BACI|nr:MULTISPECIES: YpjP family protein [Bacillaceae]MBU9723595.1 YpjP family protein [Bacillus alkalicola]